MRILVEFEVESREELVEVLRAGREQTLYDAHVARFVVNPAQPQENNELAENSPASPVQQAQHKICPYCDNGSISCDEDSEMHFPCEMCGGTGKLRASAQ